jgi:hypothetical protein
MKLTLLVLTALTGVLANPIADPNPNAEPDFATLAKRATCTFVIPLLDLTSTYISTA